MASRVEEAYLRLMRLAEASGERRLPGLRILAERWEMSLGTLRKGVARAVAEGRLEVHQGAGIWAAGCRPRTSPGAPRRDGQWVESRLEEEIVRGTHRAGVRLPGPKELAGRLGLHPDTVRKPLHRLVARGLLERRGKGWIVPMPSRAGAGARLLCLGAGDERGRLRMDTDREWDFWREIQIEAQRCGLRPHLLAWNGEPLPLDGALGAVVSTWHRVDSVPLLESLRHSGVPTAVWVANHEELPGERFQDAPAIWFHDLAFGHEAGQAMSAHVRDLGHRKLAWVSPFHGSLWSRNRLEGLRRDLAGSGVEIVEACHDWVSEWDVQEGLHRDPSLLERLDVASLGLPGPTADLLAPLVQALRRRIGLEAFGPRLETVLESGATLWVVASDIAMLWCHHWLRERGIRVPGDLALVSFDDSRDATALGITSLRFDVQGMARAMLRQILSSRRRHRRLTRYDGMVVERISSGRLPEAGGARGDQT